MNIFEVFSDGDGRIDEPNMSSVLGFLLNPEKSHGLGRFPLALLMFPFAEALKTLPLDSCSLTDTSLAGVESFINRFSRLEVELERSVRRRQIGPKVMKGYRRDIDLIIRFYDTDSRLQLILAIENKIKASSATSVNQLAEEYEFLRSEIDSECAALNVGRFESVPIAFMYLVPNISAIDADGPIGSQWTNLDLPETPGEHGGDFKVSASWLPREQHPQDGSSIVGLARALLEMENNGVINPASSYASLLLRSLINYVTRAFSTRPSQRDGATGQYEMQTISSREFWENWSNSKPDSFKTAAYINRLIEEFLKRSDIDARIRQAGLVVKTQASKLRFTFFLQPSALPVEANSKRLPNRIVRIRLDGRTSRSLVEIQFYRRPEFDLELFRAGLTGLALESFDTSETWDVEGRDLTVLIIPTNLEEAGLSALVNECTLEALRGVLDDESLNYVAS
jgi:PD-(D/E)XK nuclease superfamily